MAIEPVEVAPKVEDFTSLSEHQEETPNVFFGSRPVLYLYSVKAKLLVSRSQFDETPVLKKLIGAAAEPEAQDGSDEVMLSNIDIWVSSQSVTQKNYWIRINSTI